MQRFRATLAYDGTVYAGFQRQAGGTPTIQGAVEQALKRVTGQPVTVLGAGRTDAGVHATGQVIAFDVAWRHEPEALLRALNANLPTDIALQTLAVAAPGFHPRYSARSRTYEYHFYVGRVRQPLWDRYAWQIPYSLDRAAMACAAALLVGEHDFATFGQPPGQHRPASTVRTVLRSEFAWGQPGERCRYTITANAFLQRMVRSIMGTLVEVGRGAMDCEMFAAVLAAADRSQAGPSAPPHGLTLVSVEY
ncbi:MAG: tRNA pseudouridine(38-40) synthase TruA [Anaerolineae bacterium]